LEPSQFVPLGRTLNLNAAFFRMHVDGSRGALNSNSFFFDPGTKSFQNPGVSLAHFEGLRGEICLHHPKHQF
jgi:hypothetical protein